MASWILFFFRSPWAAGNFWLHRGRDDPAGADGVAGLHGLGREPPRQGDLVPQRRGRRRVLHDVGQGEQEHVHLRGHLGGRRRQVQMRSEERTQRGTEERRNRSRRPM